jgi:hypothetical protein
MKITLNSALTVTIPNKQLFFGEHYIASSGEIKTKSDVIQMPIVRIRPGDGMMPRLGGMFFSSAVLTVNHDKNQFTIAQAQTKSAPSKLVAYDTKNDCLEPVRAESTTSSSDPKESSANGGSSSGSSGSNPDGTSTNTNTSSSSSSTKSTLSGGAIAGIVIGTLALLSLIGAALFLIRRRRRRTGATSPSELAAFGPGSSSDGPPTEKYAHATELDGDNHHGAELYSANCGHGFAHEMDGGGRVHEVSAGEYAVVKDGPEAQGRLT